MKLSDLAGVLKTHQLPLLRSYQAADGCMVFEFDIAGKGVTWLPGQHGIFTIPGKEVSGRKWRAFSIASAPREGVLQIATKIGDEPSSFKAVLRALQPGELIQLRGPFGWLYLQDHNSPVVMIAGGVGITPFRSIFKQLEEENHRKVTLIYSARDTYLYQEELDAIAAKDGQIEIVYTHNKEEVADALQTALAENGTEAHYFISGTPGMVAGTVKTLRGAGVQKKKILTDSFRGY